MNHPATTKVIEDWLARLESGDPAARDHLLGCARERLGRLTRKMLKGYAGVKRWEETDDVLQNALLRLHRALGEVRLPSARDFFRLAALQIRRELLDMARHYYGPLGLGAHHASGADPRGADDSQPPPYEPAAPSHEPGRLAAWAEFHAQAGALPEEEREVFDLLWYQGLSQAEAAALLGVSERTIKRRWQAARLWLHQALEGILPD